MDRYHDSLIEAELEALTRQGSIFAKAVSALAVEPEFSKATQLSKELVRRMVRHASDQLGIRLRLFALDGHLMADGNRFGRSGAWCRSGRSRRRANLFRSWRLGRKGLRSAGELAATAQFCRRTETANLRVEDSPEALEALQGLRAQAVRAAPDGGLVLISAVPVRRYKRVLGAGTEC